MVFLFLATVAMSVVATLAFLYAISPTIRADIIRYFDLFSKPRGKAKNSN